MSAKNTDIVVSDAVTPVEVEATGEDVTAMPKARGRRIKKNHTETVINAAEYESIHRWRDEFYFNSANQPTRKGYDQHFNKNGFVNGLFALRLTNEGIANMIVVLFHALADRCINNPDESVRSKSNEIYDLLEQYVSNCRNEVKAEMEAEILAKAEAIQKGE
jgi:hypothetical protein